MSPRKSKKRPARKRQTRKRTLRTAPVPWRVRFLILLLAVLAIGGVGAVKFFRTTPGRVLLVDFGFHGYYPTLQADLDRALRPAMKQAGFVEGFEETVIGETIDSRRVDLRRWRARCRGPCSYARINLELTRAIERAGGIIRIGAEIERGHDTEAGRLVFEVGSHTFPTHRIIVERSPDEQPVASRRGEVPRLALVIDDLGYSRDVVERFCGLDLPITVAVIPSLTRSTYAIERAEATGLEVLLHIPLEANEEEKNGGYEIVHTAMSDADIVELVERFILEHPGVVGVNNHQGSLATQDRRVMNAVMSVVRSHQLFFLDSLTSSKSIAYNTARQLGVPAAVNDLFLDDRTEDPAVVAERLQRLVQLARRRGTAIGIGHPKPWTYEALKSSGDLLENSGVELVFVSQLVE